MRLCTWNTRTHPLGTGAFFVSNGLCSFSHLLFGPVGVFGFLFVDRHSDPRLELPFQGCNISKTHPDLSFIFCILSVVVHFTPRQSWSLKPELFFSGGDYVGVNGDMAEIESICYSGNICDELILHGHVYPLLGLSNCHFKTVIPVMLPYSDAQFLMPFIILLLICNPTVEERTDFFFEE